MIEAIGTCTLTTHTLESMDKKLQVLIKLVPSVRVCLRLLAAEREGITTKAAASLFRVNLEL